MLGVIGGVVLIPVERRAIDCRVAAGAEYYTVITHIAAEISMTICPSAVSATSTSFP